MGKVRWRVAPDGAEYYADGYFRKGQYYWNKNDNDWVFAGREQSDFHHYSDYEENPETQVAQEWPEESRIDIISTNGGDGLHYDRNADEALGAELGMYAQAKHDSEKPRYDLLPPIAIDLMAQVMTFGAKKYKPEGWRTVPDALQRYQAALLRHSFAMLRGEINDTESGLPHAAHAMCCAAFIAELQGA